MSTPQLPSTASSSSDDNDIKIAYSKNEESEIFFSPDQKHTITKINISEDMMTEKELETIEIIKSGRGFEKGFLEDPESNVEEMSRKKYDSALHANKLLGKSDFNLRKELGKLREKNKNLRLFVEAIVNQHKEDWRVKNEWMDERDKEQKKKIKELKDENEKFKKENEELKDQLKEKDPLVAASSSTDSSARSTPAHSIHPTPITFSAEIEEYLQKHGGNMQFCKSFVALPWQEVRAVPMPSELFKAFRGKRTDIRYDEEAQEVFHSLRSTLEEGQTMQLATGQVTLKEKKTRAKRIASTGRNGEPSQKKTKTDRVESDDDQEEVLDENM